jgi:hypothetical protein
MDPSSALLKAKMRLAGGIHIEKSNMSIFYQRNRVGVSRSESRGRFCGQLTFTIPRRKDTAEDIAQHEHISCCTISGIDNAVVAGQREAVQPHCGKDLLPAELLGS